MAHHKVDALKLRGPHGAQGISGINNALIIAAERSEQSKMTGHLIGIAGKLTVAIVYRSGENKIAMVTCETASWVWRGQWSIFPSPVAHSRQTLGVQYVRLGGPRRQIYQVHGRTGLLWNV